MPFKESSLELLIPGLDHIRGVVQRSAAKLDMNPRQLVRLGRLSGFADILKR
ncbi:hypothetical protein BBP40_010783 [Aspergillus hancockii]|nr:hypothetical protein BBP40_010783 [Aspergillus hancockii]